MDDPTHTVDTPTKPAQRFRRARIAVSVFFGVLAFALGQLWVASQRGAVDICGKLPGRYDFAIQSLHGGTSIHFFRGNVFWSIEFLEADGMSTGDGIAIDNPNFFFHAHVRDGGSSFNAPIWVLVFISGALATLLLFLPFRFSLRTMLFATTLVAFVLGLAIRLAR